MNHVGKAWVIVLAGGSGERLRTVTTSPTGRSIPKQFCRLNGRDSMLSTTITRSRGLTDDSHILVVVLDAHRSWWKQELAGVHSDNILVESRNRGTALALPSESRPGGYQRALPSRQHRPPEARGLPCPMA